MSNKKHDVVEEQHKTIGNVSEGAEHAWKRNEHPDAQWFGDAGFGMFIHWGISSVKGQGDLSWSMMKLKEGSKKQAEERYGPYAVGVTSTPAEYWEQAKNFKPDQFDPDKWLKAAKAAGCQYAVLTTRHHDGYALWPSKFGELNTATYWDGTDLVRGFIEACRRNDMKVGLYYSPPDWYYNREHSSFKYGNEKPALDIHHKPIELPTRTPEEKEKWDEDYRTYIRGQVEELLTNYGQIDIFWFDGSGQNAISPERIRELQPGILMNGRGHGMGDFKTPECRFPEERIEGWWELCWVWADGAWGYLKHETYKPSGWVLDQLAKCRAWNGNLLLNAAPNGHGEMPYTYYQRFETIREWMEHSGEAIFGVTGGCYPEKANVPVTCRENRWYLIATYQCDWTIEVQDVDKPKKVSLLRTGEELEYTYEDRKISLDFPSAYKTMEGDVIAVDW